MKSLRFLDRRAGYSLSAIGLMLGMVAPAAIPAFASAGVTTSRSITLSNSAASATNVSYEVKATLPSGLSSGGGAVIQFCSNSPLIDTACTATDMDVSGVAVGSGGGTAADIDSTNHGTIQWTAGGAISASGNLDVVFTGINNPTTTATFFARITTYDDATALATYTNATTLGTYADSGAVALSTTTTVGVTAYVLESMTFCVASVAPTPDCANASSNLPSMTIGETIGNGQLALDTAHVSTGTDYMQLSTNAVGGAVVNLKSDATSCGGLKLFGATGCIPGQNSNGSTVVAGTAGFGLKLGTVASASGATNPSGTLQAAASSHYDTSNYYVDSASDNSTGVTSTYGSKFVDTNSAAVSNKNLGFTVGATIGNNTPAGKYTANLNMIATGTF
ncbi:MAG TPA: hypothetical protein VLF59_03850 [Candidatus Saccharimonadales bacterium]|nr:hypothetical protein [Candidatus Saccharimonadales bacterium]